MKSIIKVSLIVVVIYLISAVYLLATCSPSNDNFCDFSVVIISAPGYLILPVTIKYLDISQFTHFKDKVFDNLIDDAFPVVTSAALVYFLIATILMTIIAINKEKKLTRNGIINIKK